MGYLSNKEVLEIFNEFGPREIQWLDDSSCNVIFETDDVPPKLFQKFTSGEPQPEPWIATTTLTVGKTQPQRGKAPKSRCPLREFKLELRLATEADRKDP